MKRLKLFPILLVFILCPAGARAQTTAFTYQGKLTDGGNAANAAYDMQFKLFDAAVSGNQIGATLAQAGVPVAGGIFTVRLDFGGGFDGSDRWLEIAIKPAGGPNYTTLNPRQQFTSGPHALQAANAATAVSATDSARLGGVLANQYVLTGDARLTDARPPTAGSSNYIQNSEQTPQNAGFNVAGNGFVGGQLRADSILAASSFGLNNARVFHKVGTNNIFIGTNAGFSNQNGSDNTIIGDNAGRSLAGSSNNSFFGSGSGEMNATGSGNAFFGYRAGQANAIANKNSFFGAQAGQNNTAGSNSFFGYQAGLSTTNGGTNSFMGQEAGKFNTTGRANVFLGATTGSANITGSNNTLLGQGANLGADNLTFAGAIGSGALVTGNDTIVIGKIAGIYGGILRPADAVEIPGNLSVTGNLQANGANLSELNAGNITGGILAVERGGTGLTSSGEAGKFLRSNGLNWSSAAIGIGDLPDLSPGFIRNSLQQQVQADFNIGGSGFVGGLLSGSTVNAGVQFNLNNTRILAATNNSLYLGEAAGQNNSGNFNSFMGHFAGQSTTNGSNNSFFGYYAGAGNQTGESNSFFGSGAGFFNTASGNSFFGASAGYSNVSGIENSFFGSASGNVNSTQSYNSFFGSGSGNFNTGSFNSFFGYRAGLLNSGAVNSFFGTYAGQSNQGGTQNVFVGFSAGDSNINGDDNTFLGHRAGFSNTGNGNTLVGSNAGAGISTGNNNTLVGANSAVVPTDLSNATAVGANAIVTQSNSLVLGSISGSNGANATVNVGIGTAAPAQRLDVRSGNIYVGSAGQGIVLKAPNGITCAMLSLNNAGALVTSAIPCP